MTTAATAQLARAPGSATGQDGPGIMNQLETAIRNRRENQQDGFRLYRHEISQIERALGSASPFGQVRLIVKKGRLAFIDVMQSRSVAPQDSNRPEPSARRSE